MPPSGVSSIVATGCSFAFSASSAKYGSIDCGISVSTMSSPAAAISLKRVSTFAGVNCARIASCS